LIKTLISPFRRSIHMVIL